MATTLSASVPRRYSAQAVSASASLEDCAGWTTEKCNRLKSFIEERREAFNQCTRIGVIKRDSDLRDFLAQNEPQPHVSGMLDWEHLRYSVTDYDCVVAYLRLSLFDRVDLWPAYREGYEKEAGIAFEQDRAIEYLLAVRALGPALNLESRILHLLEQLIGGSLRPFAGTN